LNLRSHGKSSDGIYKEYTEPIPSAQEIDSNSVDLVTGIKRMADCARAVGPTEPVRFGEVEISKNMPPSWLSSFTHACISEYSIGVVTYLGRYETNFQPFMREPVSIFPDREITVFINGHYDIVQQTAYLKKITAQRRSGRTTNIRSVSLGMVKYSRPPYGRACRRLFFYPFAIISEKTSNRPIGAASVAERKSYG
jgi:hypothetical protein